MLEDIKENIQIKHQDDHAKITQAWSQNHLTKGEFRQLLNSSPELRFSTFEEFIETLRCLVLPGQSLHHFEAPQKLLDFQWDSSHTIASSTLSIHKFVNKFLKKHTEKEVTVNLPEKMITAITISFLYC